MFHLWHSRLQHDIFDEQRRRAEHRRHHHQHIRPARHTVGGHVQQEADSIFVVRCHGTHFTWNAAGKVSHEVYEGKEIDLMYCHGKQVVANDRRVKPKVNDGGQMCYICPFFNHKHQHHFFNLNSLSITAIAISFPEVSVSLFATFFVITLYCFLGGFY